MESFRKSNIFRNNLKKNIMENTFVKKRTRILQWLVNFTAPIYMSLTKKHKKAWKYKINDLRNFPSGSLGKEMANFLDQHRIDLIPKAERHDVFHILTGYHITPEEETMMQFWLLGNRKFTPYTIGTCIIGFILIPEHWSSFIQAIKKGMQSPCISNWDFESMLYINLNQIIHKIHFSYPTLSLKKFN